MEEITNLTLLERIQLATQRMGIIEKNIEVGKGFKKYKAVAEGDVIKRVKEVESECGLISIPIQKELVKLETIKTINSDGLELIEFYAVIKLKLRIGKVEDAAESLIVESYGMAKDYGDKAIGMASTYARKYAFLDLYKINTAEDPDEFASEPMKAIPVNEQLIKITNYVNDHPDEGRMLFETFGVNDLNELNKTDIERIYKRLKL